MVACLIFILALSLYMYVTKSAFENDFIWINLSNTHPPSNAVENPIFQTLKRGVFRVKIGNHLRNLSTQQPMAVSLNNSGIVIQQHNYLCINGGRAIEIKWNEISGVKKRFFIGLKIIDIKHNSIDKVISIMCMTKKAEKTLDKILEQSNKHDH